MSLLKSGLWAGAVLALACAWLPACDTTPTEPDGNGRFSPTPTNTFTPFGFTPQPTPTHP